MLEGPSEGDVEFVDVVQEDDWLSLIAIPPLVPGFRVRFREGVMYCSSFSAARLSHNPCSAGGGEAGNGCHVVSFDTTKAGVLTYSDIGWDGFEVTEFGGGPGIFPPSDFKIAL